MPSIVQFIHPGGEHAPDNAVKNYKSWNHREHKRKFLNSEGLFLTKGISSPRKGNLVFWGEWEPPTDVIGPLFKPNRLYPSWLHSRILPVIVPQNFGGLQNTDPFVFDGPFRYFICHQSNKNMNPTALANLKNGSLILFGSYCKENDKGFFQLDTVFVVGASVQYDVSNNNMGLFLNHASQDYYNISYLRAIPNVHCYPLNLRLYEGATYSSKVNEMYSFVPSKIKENIRQGFPRVKIKSDYFVTEFQQHMNNHHEIEFDDNENFINNNLNINYKETQDVDIQIIERVWKKIIEISRSEPNGCVEGVEFH